MPPRDYYAQRSTPQSSGATYTPQGGSSYQSGGRGGEFGGTPTTVVDPRTFENVVERERDYGGTTYVPSERKEDKYGMGYYESTLLPSGLSNDPETWTYGEFGYGPGKQYSDDPDFKSWLSKYRGIVDPNYEPSWSDITQFGIRTGKPWADPDWLVGGKPGEIGKKMDLGIGTTGGGPGGGGGGWGGYGGGGADGGGYGGYGPAGGPTPEQMAGFYTPQANLQQAMINVHRTPTGFQPGYKRGGIVSLLRLN